MFRYQSVDSITKQLIKDPDRSAHDRWEPQMIPPICILEADTPLVLVVKSKTIRTIKLLIVQYKSSYFT